MIEVFSSVNQFHSIQNFTFAAYTSSNRPNRQVFHDLNRCFLINCTVCVWNGLHNNIKTRDAEIAVLVSRASKVNRCITGICIFVKGYIGIRPAFLTHNESTEH